jgi:hypothetical protein
MFQPMQCWIQSALIDAKHILRELTDALRDGPTVHWLQTHNLQDEQVKRTL